MTCAAVRERLPDYLEAALPAADQEAVAAHLAACPECRAEVEAARWSEAALTPLTSVEEAPAALAGGPWLRPHRPRVRLIAVGAAAMLGLFALLVFRPVRPIQAPAPLRRPHDEAALERGPSAPPVSPAPSGAEGRPSPNRLSEVRMPSGRGGPPMPPLAPRPVRPEPEGLAVVVVEPATDLPPTSSYQATVRLPDGTTSSLEQRISRDDGGAPREISIVRADAPSPRAQVMRRR